MIQRRSFIRETVRSKRISDKFVERIMLATTAVNDCRYYTWGNTKMALKLGISQEEINSIYNSDFDGIPQEQRLALLFAQDFAETENQPSMEAINSLFQYYGRSKGNDIMNYIRMISMGNLAGNTVDAFESRLNGIPSEDGSFLIELLFYTLSGGPLLKKLFRD